MLPHLMSSLDQLRFPRKWLVNLHSTVKNVFPINSTSRNIVVGGEEIVGSCCIEFMLGFFMERLGFIDFKTAGECLLEVGV